MINNNYKDFITFLTVNLDKAGIDNLDEFISDY